MSGFMSDLSLYINGTSSATKPTHSTSRDNNTELNFNDMLNLMVVQLQNQTMDNTMDTSQMLSQMIQMQVVQSINSITDATVMTYASSLVGKDVTVGEWSADGELKERLVHITGTGYSDGQQVLFAGDEVISLKDIMAVGKLPEIKKPDEEGGDKKPEDSTKPGQGVGGVTDNPAENTNGAGEDGTTAGEGGGKVEPADPAAGN